MLNVVQLSPRLRSLALGILMASGISAILFSELILTKNTALGASFRSISDDIGTTSRQWLYLLAIIANLGILLTSEFSKAHLSGLQHEKLQIVLISCFTLLGLSIYAIFYSDAAATHRAIVLFGSILTAKLARHVALSLVNPKFYLQCILCGLCFSFVAAYFTDHPGTVFRYRGLNRWSGAWASPNTFGLLMATLLLIALGYFSHYLRALINSTRTGFSGLNRIKYIHAIVVFGLTLMICLGVIALFQSYSRGAWLALSVGLFYLRQCRVSQNPSIAWLPGHTLLLFAILLSTVAILYCNFRFTDQPLTRRLSSIGNPNDLSWRNRVSAWEGGFQSISHRPWRGWGWNQPQTIYDDSYRNPLVAEAGAMQTNDWIWIGVALGLPAMLLLALYVLRSLRGPGITSRFLASKGDSLEQHLCRACACVIAIGCWFDGGLFHFPTATVFWVLLELGKPITPDWNRMPFSSELRRLAMQGIWLILVLGYIVCDANARDLFERYRWSYGLKRQASVVVPKRRFEQPIIVLLYPWGEKESNMRRHVRIVAELGYAAVAIEVSTDQQAEFNQDFSALLESLRAFPYGDSTRVAWVGFKDVVALQLQYLHSATVRPTAIAGIGGFKAPVTRFSTSSLKQQPHPNTAREAETFRTKSLRVWIIAPEHSTVADKTSLEHIEAFAQVSHAEVNLTTKPIFDYTETDIDNDLRAAIEFFQVDFPRVQKVSLNMPRTTSFLIPMVLGFCLIIAYFFKPRGLRRRITEARTRSSLELISIRIGLGLVILTCIYSAVQLYIRETTVSMGIRIGILRFVGLVDLGSELDFLLRDPRASKIKLKHLIEHATLARQQRHSFSGLESDEIYRSYVMNPWLSNGEENIAWRGLLWRGVHPRVRAGKDPRIADHTIYRFLQTRITIRPQLANDEIVNAWNAGVANLDTFRKIHTAALRSVGIPARITQGVPEFWYGGSWYSSASAYATAPFATNLVQFQFVPGR